MQDSGRWKRCRCPDAAQWCADNAYVVLGAGVEKRRKLMFPREVSCHASRKYTSNDNFKETARTHSRQRQTTEIHADLFDGCLSLSHSMDVFSHSMHVILIRYINQNLEKDVFGEST